MMFEWNDSMVDLFYNNQFFFPKRKRIINMIMIMIIRDFTTFFVGKVEKKTICSRQQNKNFIKNNHWIEFEQNRWNFSFISPKCLRSMFVFLFCCCCFVFSSPFNKWRDVRIWRMNTKNSNLWEKKSRSKNKSLLPE